MDFWVIGHVAYGTCIIVANVMICFRFNNYTGWGEWTCTGMVLAFFTIFYIQSLLPFFPQIYYIYDTVMEQPLVWIQFICIAIIAAAFEMV